MPPCEIAVVIADLGAGGAQRVAVNLVAGLVALGKEACLVTLGDRSTDHFRPDPRVKRIELGLLGHSGGGLRAVAANVWRVRALRRAIRASGSPQVVALVGVTNILTILACTGMRVRVVISERNDPRRQSLGRAWDFLRRLLYRRADVVTANSVPALEAMAAYVPREKLVLVRNAIEVPGSFDATRGPSRRVLTVGRLSRQKAQDVLLRAFSLLPPTFADWRLIVVGSGEEAASLRRLADEQGISSRVEWVDKARDDIWDIYRAADVFALPSRHEGTPNALLEAMACGLPAVVSDATSGALDYVTDQQTGLVVPVEDAAALAAALATLMGSAELRARLGAAGQRRIRETQPASTVAAWAAVLGLSGAAAA